MEKVIEVAIQEKEDLVEKYSDKKVRKELIEYILDEAMDTNKKDEIKIVITKKFNTVKDYSSLIIQGFKREYEQSLKLHHLTDLKQFAFLIWGILSLFISTKVSDTGIWEELFLIGGWVPLWEMIDLEIFSDIQEKRKRKILKKLINAKIVEE